MTEQPYLHPYVVPLSVLGPDNKPLSRPATEHEQTVLNDVMAQFSDEMYQAAMDQGVNILGFLVPEYRAVITPDELEQRGT